LAGAELLLFWMKSETGGGHNLPDS